LANTSFQTVYNYTGLGLNFEIRRNGIRWNETKHVELEQFLHAFTSRGFDSVSWAFLLRIPIKCNIIIVLFISYWYVLFSGTAIPAIFLCTFPAKAFAYFITVICAWFSSCLCGQLCSILAYNAAWCGFNTVIYCLLADHTNGRAYATVLRLSSVCNITDRRQTQLLCIVAKRCTREQKLLLSAYSL